MTHPAGGGLDRCVGDGARFLAQSFTVAPHRWRGASFDDLLSLDDVDRALTGHGLRRPAVRLVRDGEVLDRATYTRRARTGSVTIDDLIDPARVLDLFAGGATIVLQSLQRWWPPLQVFCRDLERALGHAVQANAYLTPAGATGLAPHHDTHDVFVLQVHGRKHWAVREPLMDSPLPRHRSDHAAAGTQPLLFETDLEAGDCLYLPRGFIHSASAQEGVSLHLTIGVLATTVHDLLRRLVDRAAEEPALRRNLPGGYSTDGDAALGAVKGAVADLLAWLEQLDPVTVADDLRRSAPIHRPPLLHGQLRELVHLPLVDDATAVRRRAGVVVDVELDGDTLRLTATDRTIELPAPIEPAVARLLDGASHAVGDLADLLDGGSRLVLVRRLVREGLLQTTADG